MTTPNNADGPEMTGLEDLLAELGEIETEPGATFDTPWQARALAIAVATLNNDEWEEFQHRFVDRIDTLESGPNRTEIEQRYYDSWLAVLEEYLFDVGHITPRELEQRQEQFESGERDESEFVLEDPRDQSL